MHQIKQKWSSKKSLAIAASTRRRLCIHFQYWGWPVVTCCKEEKPKAGRRIYKCSGFGKTRTETYPFCLWRGRNLIRLDCRTTYYLPRRLKSRRSRDTHAIHNNAAAESFRPKFFPGRPDLCIGSLPAARPAQAHRRACKLAHILPVLYAFRIPDLSGCNSKNTNLSSADVPRKR